MHERRSDSLLLDDARKADRIVEGLRQEALLKTGALQNAILTSANFSIIATDEKGIIQLFNVGAERMLGYQAAEVVNKISPSDIHDPQEVMARAQALSVELATTITPGFEALVFKASRGIEDIYELTYICKDGSRFPAIVSITALRDDYGDIIGYLLIGTDNSVRKQVELAVARRHGRRREGQPREVGFPVQHEPRAAHAAERDPRLRAADGIGRRRRRRSARSEASIRFSRRAGTCWT